MVAFSNALHIRVVDTETRIAEDLWLSQEREEKSGGERRGTNEKRESLSVNCIAEKSCGYEIKDCWSRETRRGNVGWYR